MSQQTWLEIDRKALKNNFQLFRKLLGKSTLMPVVKSNAYGHGLAEVVSALKDEKPTYFAVNEAEEAVIIRDRKYDGRILVLGPLDRAGYELARDHRCEIILPSHETLEMWLRDSQRPKAHLKIDSGMGRQGFWPDECASLIPKLGPFQEHFIGICTHFANVEDVLAHDYARTQWQEFARARQIFRDRGFSLMAHAASSASALLLDEWRADAARIGISLYGLWPSIATKLSYLQTYDETLALQPALTWKTQIGQLKRVPKGAYVGYGCSFRAVTDMTLAVLPVGYNEGFPRVAGEALSYVLIQGTRCRTVGRICMNMMMVDVSHLPSGKVGEEVTLIGRDGDETIGADLFAEWSRTIHYEALTKIHPSLPRRLV